MDHNNTTGKRNDLVEQVLLNMDATAISVEVTGDKASQAHNCRMPLRQKGMVTPLAGSIIVVHISV